MITVEKILDLLTEWHYSFRIYTNGRTFEFGDDNIPGEIFRMKVESIDDPTYTDHIPLCLNISEDEFADFDSFEEEYKDYLVKD